MSHLPSQEPEELTAATISAFLRTVDPTLEIEDPSDRRLFDSILSRPRDQVKSSHVRFMSSLIKRNGRKFRAGETTNA